MIDIDVPSSHTAKGKRRKASRRFAIELLAAIQDMTAG